MKTISRDELKGKLDKKDNFTLVFVLDEAKYRMRHIPGSINIAKPMNKKTVASLDTFKEVLKTDDEIVVYCSDVTCPASIAAYHLLTKNGYDNVRRYAGGLADWDEAGYSLEGHGHSVS